MKINLGLPTTLNLIADDVCFTGASGCSGPQTALLGALGFDPVGLDALQSRCGIDTAALQAQLMTLELDGLLVRLPGGLFQRLSPG